MRLLIPGIAILLMCAMFTMAQAPGAGSDPKTPVFWSAAQLKQFDSDLAPRVSSQTNMAGQRLLASASMIYRAGNSGSEIHEKEADFIFVREGEGAIVVGGKMIGGKPDRPGE